MMIPGEQHFSSLGIIYMSDGVIQLVAEGERL